MAATAESGMNGLPLGIARRTVAGCGEGAGKSAMLNQLKYSHFVSASAAAIAGRAIRNPTRLASPRNR
jgi:ABC-type molybdenum transport system ATPase subunit/photorepair protein PhrA